MSHRNEKATWDAIEINPGDAHAWMRLGHVFQTKGQLVRAEVAFRKATQLNPNWIKAWESLLPVVSLRHKYEDTVEVLNTIIRLKPDRAGEYRKLLEITKRMHK
ncbi:MAG: tetratricopeptide repeat protein [Candidatus Thorarchaeota archaeon]